ncbi:DUF4282 domain-containing protein [Corynebacterium auriscanis]|uniref:DUF4282 domain-containing protein n=1 Tax=Corynebacterium auriscanis TaxID=99807 RepID=UPI002246A372|nr:DUF4282 domain-containing protein [Corynebacterium auriscanis]MCX2163400.1 DUF4282 domain-containing protein [Corynebacterium auriscanis]
MTYQNTPYRDGGPNIQMGSKQDTFFSALFNFGFTKYVTPSLVRVLYILGIVVIVLWALMPFVGALLGISLLDSLQDELRPSGAYGDYSPYTNYPTYGSELDSQIDKSQGAVAGYAAMSLVTGAIGALIQIGLLRISLEVLMALMRTAEAWQRIKQRHEAGIATL